MRKNLIKFSALTLLLALSVTACKKKENPGTVTLDPTSKNVKFGEKYTITPKFSATGDAKDKTYTWHSNADSIASVKAITGGYGEVEAKRIGDAIISYESSDGVFKVKSSVTVMPRTRLLNGFYFKKGATETEVTNQIPRGFKKRDGVTDNTLLIFDSNDAQIPSLIYQLENGQVKVLNIILKNDIENLKEAEEYIEERFVDTGRTKDRVLYYKNTGMETFPLQTVLGVFKDAEIGGESYGLGVRIMDASDL